MGFMLSPYLVFLLFTALIWGLVWAVSSIAGRYQKATNRRGWRIFSFWSITGGSLMFAMYLTVLSKWYTGNGFANILLILYANLNLAIAFHRAATHFATRSPRARALVDAGYMAMDMVRTISYITVYIGKWHM
jgi:hypothetical protein